MTFLFTILIVTPGLLHAASWHRNNPPFVNPGTYNIAGTGNRATGSFDISYKPLLLKKIEVKTNKNIELFGLMMQLDMGQDLLNSTDSVLIENKKVTWRDWYRQSFKNYLRYRRFDSSKMMSAFRSLQSKKLYNDFFIAFLLQVDEVPFATINANTDKEAILPFSPKGDFEEAKKNAEDFLFLFNDFYKEVHFDDYLKENKHIYELIKADVEKNLPGVSFLPTMENFYQKQFNSYCLVPSLNIPTSMGFGKTNKSTLTIYNVFGPFSFQSLDTGHLNTGFNYPAKIQGLSVHEFGHSFVNPAIDKVPTELINSTEYLYTPIKTEMSKLAYTSWTMCLYEHFVKAGEVIIARKLGNTKEAKKILEDNVKAKFIYLPAIVKELEEYDKNKSDYKSYDDVVPVTIERLKALKKQ
jgi:hypothetical protein